MKDLRGSLIRNDYKRVDNAPDFLGDCVVDGKPFKLAAWENFSPDGKPILSLSFTSEEDFKRIREKKRAERITPENHPNSMENQF